MGQVARGRWRRFTRVTTRLIPARVRAVGPERVAGAVGTRVVRVGGMTLVVAGSTDHLRDVTHGPLADTPTTRVRIVVAYWRHFPNWSHGIRPTPHLVRHRVALPHLRRGTAVVTLRYTKPVPLATAVDAALSALAPTHPWPPRVSDHNASTDIADPTALAEVGAPDSPPPSTEPDPADGRSANGSAHVRGAGARDAGRAVVFDATRVNPVGRRADAYLPDAAQERIGRPTFDAATLARLRRARTVAVSAGPGPGPGLDAADVAALAATGAVVEGVGALPAAAREGLATELLDLLAAPAPADGDGDALAAEARSVRHRRAALRHHAAGLTGRALPTVSAILATRRPELIGPALGMLAGQTYPMLEIVICLHGVAAPRGLAAAMGGRPHQIVELPAGASFGEVLGVASARAGGELLTKVDDDDTYGPEHVWDLVLARHYSGATLVGKGSELVFLESRGTVVRRASGVPEAYGELVSGGTMLIARGDLDAVGGWRPVPRSVDLGLVERLRRAGATIYRTHPLGYVYHRRAAGHTWDPGEAYFVDAARTTWPSIPPDALA